MTLIVVAHNDKDIVIGSDTLTTVDIDGTRRPDITNRDKIRALNGKAALGLSGYFTSASEQFIKDFCYNNRKAKDVIALRNSLLRNVANTLTLEERELLQITLAGFTDGKPRIEVLEIRSGVVPKASFLNVNFHAIGFKGPSERAVQLLLEKNVQAKPRERELRKIVRDTLNTCTSEFSSSNNERLGGKPHVIALHRSWF